MSSKLTHDKHMNILLVDDDPIFLKLASSYLTRTGYTVRCTESGKKCLESIDNGDMPDIIIMDYMMPEMNGIETLDELHSNDLTKHIPVIITSIHDEDEKLLEAQSHKAFGYFYKGSSLDELSIKIIRIVNEHKLCFNL